MIRSIRTFLRKLLPAKHWSKLVYPEPPDNPHPGNVSGKYYVGYCSLYCGLCESIAPKNFRMNDELLMCEVYKQPENAEEEAACEDAMAQSCVACIRDDGEIKNPPRDRSEEYVAYVQAGRQNVDE